MDNSTPKNKITIQEEQISEITVYLPDSVNDLSKYDIKKHPFYCSNYEEDYFGSDADEIENEKKREKEKERKKEIYRYMNRALNDSELASFENYVEELKKQSTASKSSYSFLLDIVGNLTSYGKKD